MQTQPPVDRRILEQRRQLARTRRELVALPPQQALEKILEAPQPAALVHSFPAEDLFLLVHDIGPDDALPLLSLASNRQWEYFLDMEVWHKDQPAVEATTEWLDRLFEADPERLVKWSLEQQLEFTEWYLFRNVEVRIREFDQAPSDFGEGFFSDDDTYYVRIRDQAGAPADGLAEERRRLFLSRFLKRLSNYDHVAYQHLLLESDAVLPAESEEELFRLRTLRLAEKGFLPFDQAIGIYQPLRPADVVAGPPKHLDAPSDAAAGLPVPLFATGLLPADNRFVGALGKIASQRILEQLQQEFAGLCNQVIAADVRTVRSREALGQVVKKVCGFVSLGLEQTSDRQPPAGSDDTATLIARVPLERLFRVGYGRVLALKWRASKWEPESWFAGVGLPLGFWGETWLGVLGGLLIKKPLFFDNFASGDLYREFYTAEDLDRTARMLDQVIAFDNLFALLGVDPGPLAALTFLNYKNVILTLWARHVLGLGPSLEGLRIDQLRQFFALLFSPPAKAPDAGRTIASEHKTRFLEWLAGRSGLTAFEISQRLGVALEDLFAELESEYRMVAPQDLDPRYILMFLLKK